MDNNSIDKSGKRSRNRSFINGLNKKNLFKILFCLLIFFNVTALFGQTHVSNGSDSGQNTVDVPCASVEYILRYSCDFTATPHASSKYSLYVWWNWDPDNPGSPDVRYTNTGTIPSSQILFNVTPTGGDTYSVTVRASHVYSDVNCSYQAHMRLYYRDDDGDGQLHPIEATDQDQVFPVWHTDNIRDAGGQIDLTPDTLRVCEGAPLVGFQFQDVSDYACTRQVDPSLSRPNHISRWQQYVYGGPSTFGIPNLYIMDGANQIFLTDENGAPTAQNPYYGDVNEIIVNDDGSYSIPQALPISFDGVGTQADQFFPITTRNWNICNPYPSSAPNEDTSIILIIDSPPPPEISSRVICNSDASQAAQRTLTVASNYTPQGTIYWYADYDLTNQVATGRSYVVPDRNPGVYTYWLVDRQENGNRCPSLPTEVSLTIREQLPAIGDIEGPNPVCIGTDVQFSISDLNVGPMPIGGPTELVWTVPSDWQILGGQGTTTISVRVGTETGAHSVSVSRVFSSSPACGVTSSMRLNVTTLAEGGTITGSSSICINNAPTLNSTTANGRIGNIVRWEYRYNNGEWTEIPGSAATPTLSTFTLSAAGSWDFRVLVDNGCSQDYSSHRTVTVAPASVGGTTYIDNSSVCVNEYYTITVTGHTGNVIRWQRQLGGTTGTWSTISSTATSYRTRFTTLGNDVSRTYYYRAVIQSSPCSLTYSEPVAITIYNTSQGGSVSGGNTPICVGSSTGTMTSTGRRGSIVRWQRKLSTSTTWTNIDGTAGQPTYSEVPSSTGIWQYRVVVQNGPCAVAYSTARSITVNPLSVGGSVGGPTSICYSAIPSSSEVFTVTGNVGTVRGWQRQLDGTAEDGWSPNLGNTPTYNVSNVPQVAGTWYYRAIVQSGECEAVYSEPHAIVVYPQFISAGLSLSANSICNNETVDITATVNGGVPPYTLTYSIYKDGNLETAGLTETFSTTTHTWTSGQLTSTTTDAGYEYRINSVVDGNGCSVDNINPSPHVEVGTLPETAVIDMGDDVCSGSNGSMTLTVNGGGAPYTVVYTVNDGTSTTTHTVQTSSVIDLGVLTSNGSSTRTYTYDIRSITDNCNQVVPESGITWYNGDNSIVANPIPNISASTMDTPVICNGSAVGFTLRTDVDNTNFSWTATASDGVTVNGLSDGSRTNVTGSVVVNSTLSHSYTAPVTVTYTITPTGPIPTACPGDPIVLTAVVNPVPVMNTVANQVVCNGTSTTQVVFGTTNTGGTTRYTWTVSGDNIGLPASGEGDFPATTVTNNGTLPITNTVTVTPHYSNGGIECDGASTQFEIIVNPTITTSSISSSTVCAGDNVSAVTLGSNYSGTTGNVTYSWTVTGASIGLTSGTGNSIPSFTAINPTTEPVDARIRVTPILNVADNLGCIGNSTEYTITVNPTAQVNTVGNVTVPNGGTVGPIAFSTDRTGGTTTYSWYMSTDIGIGTGTNSGNIQFTAVNNGTSPISSVVTVTPTFTNNGVSCEGDTIRFTITVNPTGQVDDLQDIILCAGEPTGQIHFTSPNVGTTFNWTNSNTAIGLAASGTGDIASFNVINTTNAPVTATIVVTSVFEGVEGNQQSFDIIVNPRAQVNAVNNITICNGSRTTQITFSTVNTGGTTTYRWTNDNPSIGLSSSGTGNIPAFPATNSTTSTATATIRVTPYFSNEGVECSGDPITFTITVYPTPTLSSALTATLCSSGTFSYTPTSATAGTTFSWTRGALPTGVTATGDASGTGSINQTLRNVSNTPRTVTYTYTLTANGCVNTQDVVVTVNPEAVITSGQTTTTCSSVQLSYRILMDNFTNPGDGVTFTWPTPVLSAGITGGTARSNASSANISDTFVNLTGSAGTATYTVTPIYNGCTGTPVEIVVNVNPQPILANLNTTVCSNTATGLMLSVATGSVPATSYNVTNIRVATRLETVRVATVSNNVSDSYLSNDIFRNRTGAPLNVIYTVAPVSADGCVGAAQEITVAINPEPVIRPNQTPVACSNAPINYEILLIPANIPAGTTFSWNAPVISDGSVQGTAGVNVPADPAGSFHITDAIVNRTGSDITATYSVTPTSGNGCVGETVDIVVVIHPEPITSEITGERFLCLGANSVMYSVDNHENSTYTWDVPAGFTVQFNNNNYFIIVDATSETAPNSVITVYETNTITGCVGEPVSIPVSIVTSIPSSSLTGPTELCVGERATYSVPYRDGSTYTWTLPSGASPVGSMNGNEITVTFIIPITGEVSVIETNVGSCTTTHTPLAVNVHEAPTAFTLTAPPAYCEGVNGLTITLSSSETGVSYQMVTSDGTNTVNFGDPIVGTGSALTWDNCVAGPSLSYSVIATNTVTGCTNTMDGVITPVVNAIDGGDIDVVQSICIGSTPQPFTSVAATGSGNITYQWYSSSDNFATSQQIPGATSEIYAPVSLTQDTYFWRVAYSTVMNYVGTSVCEASSDTIYINVINFDAGAIGNEQTICPGTIPAPFISRTDASSTEDDPYLDYAYQWQISIDGINFVDLSTPGATAAEYTHNEGLTQDTWFRRRVTATCNNIVGSASCAQVSAAVRVYVINFLPGSISGSQVIAYNEQPNAFSQMPATGDGIFTYQWQDSTANGTWQNVTTGTVSPTGETYTPPRLTENTWYRRVATATLNSSTCQAISNVVSVLVINFNPGTIAEDQTICYGDVPATITGTLPTSLTTETYTYSYQWQSSTNGEGFINIMGATGQDYTPTTGLTQDVSYRRVVTAMYGSTSCVMYTDTVTVTVNNLTIGTIRTVGTNVNEQFICYNSDATPIEYTGTIYYEPGAVVSLQWQYLNSSVTEWTNIAGETGNTLSPTALTLDTRYRLMVTSELNGHACVMYTNEVTIEVIEISAGSLLDDQVICAGTTAALIVGTPATGDGTFSYRWYRSTDNGATFTQIAGSGESLNPGTLGSDALYYRVAVSNLNNTCEATSNTISIVVNNVTAGTIGETQTICEGASPDALTSSEAATGDGTLTYQWYSSTDGVNFAPIADATNETYQPGALTQDTYYYREVISEVTLHTTGGSDISTSCSAISNTIRVYVNNLGTNILSTSDQTICINTTPTMIVGNSVSVDGGAATYQWQISTDGLTFSDITGATSVVYTETNGLSQNTWYRRIAYSTFNGVVCSNISNVVAITVVDFNPGSLRAPDPVCEGGQPQAIIATVPTPSTGYIYTYQWQRLVGGNWTNISGATSETYTPDALIEDTQFRRMVTAMVNGALCTAFTEPVTVVVNNFTIGSISGDQTVCEGGQMEMISYSGTVAIDGVESLQWQDSNDGVTFRDIPNATGSSLVNISRLRNDVWIRLRVISSLGNSLCEQYTNIVHITVVNFTPGVIGSDQTICANSVAATLTFTTPPSGDGTFSYQWGIGDEGGRWAPIPGATSDTYTPPANLTADQRYSVRITSDLNPSCSQITNTVTITVNNVTPGTIGEDQIICEGDVPERISSVQRPSGDGRLSYQWYSSTDGYAFFEIEGAEDESYSPEALTQDMWYRREAISTIYEGGNAISRCVSESSNVVRIYVNNIGLNNINGEQTVCAGSPVQLNGNIVTGDGRIRYQWQSSDDGIRYTDIDGATDPTYSARVGHNTWFRRVVYSEYDAGGTMRPITCSSVSSPVLVTVISFNAGVITGDQAICTGSPINEIGGGPATSDDGSVYTYNYQWQYSTDDVNYYNIVGANGLTYTPTNLTVTTYFRRHVVAEINGAMCESVSNIVRIIVNRVDLGTLTGTQTICESGTMSALTYSGTTSDGRVTLQWQYSADGINYVNIGSEFSDDGSTTTLAASDTLSQDGWFRLRVRSTINEGGNTVVCELWTDPVIVTVINFDPGVISESQVICDGDYAAPLTSIPPSGDGAFRYQWYEGTSANENDPNPTIVWTPIAVGGNGETYNPGRLQNDRWYYRAVTSTFNGVTCTLNTDTVYIRVNSFDAGNISFESTNIVTEMTICDGVTAPTIYGTTATGDGTITYNWLVSVDGVNYTSVGVYTPDYTPASVTEDMWFRRDVTSTVDYPVAYSCTTTSGVVRVSVINFQPGRISGDQTICEGTAPSRFTGTSASGDGVITYQWQSSTDNVNFVDIPDSPSNSSVGVYYVSPALTQNTWFRRMATSTLNGTSCVLYSDTIRVTVIVYDEGVIGSDQFVCEGTVPEPITGTAATDNYPADNYRYSYQWQQRTATGDWINIVGATDPLQYVPVDPVYEDTWFRKVTTADVAGYQCVKYSNEVVVTVNNLVVGTISTDQALCDGNSVAELVYNGTVSADGTVTLEWQYLNSTVSVFTSTGVTTDSYTPTAAIINNEDTRFRLAVTSNNGNISCTKYTNEVVITINNFDIGSLTGDQVICENTAAQTIDVVVPASGDGTLSYRWFQSPTGEDGSYVVIPNATAAWYNPGILVQDAWYYREVTSTMILGNGLSSSCSRNNTPVYIQVNNVEAGTLTGTATVCEGTPDIVVSSASDYRADGALTLQWYESNDGVVFTEIAGAQDVSYTRTAPLATDIWYKLRVTSTIGSNVCYEETDAIKITVINFDPGFIGPDQIICRNTSAATITGRAPTGDVANVYTYAWELTYDTINGTINTISGAINSSYNPGILTQDTYYRRVVYATQGSVTCTLHTNWVKVEVIDFNAGTIGSDQLICERDIPALLTNEASASGQGTFRYQWQMSYDNRTFSSIIGATAETYQPEALSYDTYFRRLAYATMGEVTCVDTSNVVVVWVNNIFNAGTVSGDQTICEGAVPDATLFVQTEADGDGTISYRWYSRTAGTAYVYRADLGSGPLFTPEAVREDTWYLREVVSSMTTGTLSLECRRNTGEIVITVNNFNPGSISGDQTICEGGVAETLTSVTPTGDGQFSYQWYSSTTGRDSGYSMIPGATSENYYPGVLTQDTWFCRQVTSTLNMVACSAFSADTVLVTVINMTAGTIGNDETICSGTAPQNAITFIVGGEPELNGGAVSYQWQESVDNFNFTNISGAVSDTYQPGVLTQDTWYRVIVTSTLNGQSCSAVSNSVLKRVNNVNGGSIISDQFICLGGDPVPLMSTSNGSGDGVISYRWEMSTDNVTFTAIANSDSPIYDPEPLYQNTYFRRVTISTIDGVSCEALSNVITVTVNEIYGGTIGSDQDICYAETPAPLTSVTDGSGSGNITYRWYRSDDGVYFSFITSTGGAGDASYTPGVHYADAWYYRETWSNLNGNTCRANSDTIHITVHPRPVGVISGNATICPGETTPLTVVMSVGTAPFEVELTSSADGTRLTVTGFNNGDIISVSPRATTTYTITRIRDANNCEVPFGSSSVGYMSGSATIVVRDLATIVAQPVDNTLCEFGIATFQVEATGTDITYQWYENGAPLTDGGFYYGANSATLRIYGVLRDMDGNVYHVEVSNCATTVTSDDVVLNVNTVPEIQLQPQDTTICLGAEAEFGVVANGTNLIYQWQVNRNDGTGFQNVVDDAVFSGSDSNTLHLTNVPGSFNNYIFRVVINGTCGTATYSNFVILRVNMPPVVTRNPMDAELCDGTGLVYFVGGGSGMIDSTRWQVSVDGVTWEDIYDNGFYSGTTTQQLTLVNVPLSFNGYRYRLSLKAFCTTVYSEPATLTVHDNPVVDFSAIDPMAACGGVAQVLDASLYTSGGSIYTQHSWTGDVGPLNNYFIQAPTFLTSVPGDYTIVYRVTDAFGCYGTDTIRIVVDKPDASFTMSELSGCTPANISFSKLDNTVVSWRWDFGDGEINTTDANPTHTFVNTNPAAIMYYNVKLVVESASGCLDSTTQMVTVYPASDASFYAEADSICSGEMMRFTGVSGAVSYYWEYGDGVSGAGSYSTSHVYINSTSAPITVDVTLTTRSAYGCTSVETRSIVVMPVPTPDFTLVEIPPYILDGGSITLNFVNSTNAGAWTYLWEFGDNTTSTEENPSHVYNNYGDFTVRLTASNGLCSSTVEKVITIIPRGPIASFAEIPSGCATLTVVTNNTSQYIDIPGTTFLWDFGDGSYSTAMNPTYEYRTPGTYRVTLTVNGPGGRSTYSQVVEVYESPRAYFEVTPTSVFVNDEAVRMFNLTSGADYYLWEFGDGDTSRLEEPYHKYMREGVYDITLWAYSNNGCSDRYILSPGVTVEPAGELRFATVFRPSQDGPTTTTGTLGENIEITLPTGGEMIDRYFFPPIREQVRNYKLQVFNRLGVLIFQSDNINCPWDGYYKGELCQQGVYVWYVEGKYANGEPFRQVGDITLLH